MCVCVIMCVLVSLCFSVCVLVCVSVSVGAFVNIGASVKKCEWGSECVYVWFGFFV